MFRHDTAELYCKMFDIALSAHCADVVSPAGKQPGRYYLPLQRSEITTRKSYPHTRRSVSVSTFTFSSVVAQLVQKRMARWLSSTRSISVK